MKNSKEYTAQDPLVAAAYELLKGIKEGVHEPLNLPNEKELAMVVTQLNFVCHASAEIRDILTNGGGYPEWFQNKLSGLHSTMQDLHSYMVGKEAEHQAVQTEQVKTVKEDRLKKETVKIALPSTTYVKGAINDLKRMGVRVMAYSQLKPEILVHLKYKEKVVEWMIRSGWDEQMIKDKYPELMEGAKAGEEGPELEEMTKAKLDRTNRISSDEYSKLRKKPFFNPKEWEFSAEDMLYHRIVEEAGNEEGAGLEEMPKPKFRIKPDGTVEIISAYGWEIINLDNGETVGGDLTHSDDIRKKALEYGHKMS